MVDFIRHYQFYKSTTNEWVEQAIKKVESNTNSPWSTYYGIYGAVYNSFGLNPNNPFIDPKRPITTHTTTAYPFYERNLGCDECEILVNLVKCPNGQIKDAIIAYMIAFANNRVCSCPQGTFQNPACCFNCGIHGISNGAPCINNISDGCKFNAGNPIEQICAASVQTGFSVDGLCTLGLCPAPQACGGTDMCCGQVDGCEDTGDCNYSVICDQDPNNVPCNNIGMAEDGWYCGPACAPMNEDGSGGELICVDEWNHRVSCSSEGAKPLGKCVCGDISTDECDLVNCPCPGDPCNIQDAGEECDTSCCAAGEEGCEPCPDGSWVPVGVPCEEAEEDEVGGEVASPCEPGSNDPTCVYCHCSQEYQPIWWPCVGPYCTEEPCDPSDPECYGGEPVVCYNYNTNDPIYYNASSLGPSVVIEYSTTEQACGGTYSYANAALLCEIPDQFQLCVYLEDANGVQTQISYDGDSPYGANTFRIDEAAATVTLSSGTCIPANGKVVMKRCTDDKKMLLSFTEGSKLSATDINASLHQLLFLIQEKEFASNNYFQVANTASLPATAYYEVPEDTTAGQLEGATVLFTSTDGTSKTYKFSESGSATGTAIAVSPPTVAVKITSMTPAQIAAQLKAAMEASAGHGSKFTITQYGQNTRKYTVRQATTGPNGNTTITESLTGTDPDLLIVPATFTGGSSTSDSAMIQFSPATTLPISFNFAGANAGQVMIWDGQEVSAANVPPLATLSNLPDVNISSLTAGQFLKWDGSNWTNAAGSSGSSTSIDLTAFLRYDDTSEAKMAEFWSRTGGMSADDSILSSIMDSWSASYISSYVSNALGDINDAAKEKATIPNAVTAYGLGYLSSMEWFKNDVKTTTGLPANFSTLTSGVMDAWWNAKTTSDPTGASPAGIHSSFTWEMSKGLGRRFTALTEAQTGQVVSPAPQKSQQGKPFHDIGDILKLDTSGSVASSRAFAENLTVAGTATPVSRVKFNNVATVTLNPSKSFTSGIGKTKFKSGSTVIEDGVPSHDYYLDYIKNALSMDIWNQDPSYNHPLYNATAEYASYPDGVKEAIKADYVYSLVRNDVTNTSTDAGPSYNYKASGSLDSWYEEQINMPTVVTYYLGTIYDAAAMTHGTTPAFPKELEWKGNWNAIFNRDLHATGATEEWYSARQYLGTIGTGSNTRNGADHFFHKWLLRVEKEDWDNTGAGTWVPEFNPHDRLDYADSSDGSKNMFLVPGLNEDGVNTANIAKYNSGYSYLIEANRTFSWLQSVMPPMYDEYVWEVKFTDNASDKNYHVVVDLSKHIDGCSEIGPVFGTHTPDGTPKRKGNTDCFSIGTNATNWGPEGTSRQSTYHLYPSDFYPEFVTVWDQVDTGKIHASTRNHQVDGFDLVLRVPRVSRIAVADRVQWDDGDGDDVWTTQALELLDDQYDEVYQGELTTHISDANSPPTSLATSEANANTAAGTPPLKPRTIASVSTEAGIQFIRMGIPANLRLDFTVLERGTMVAAPVV